MLVAKQKTITPESSTRKNKNKIQTSDSLEIFLKEILDGKIIFLIIYFMKIFFIQLLLLLCIMCLLAGEGESNKQKPKQNKNHKHTYK